MSPNILYSFLKRTLPFYSFTIFMHVLTDPFLSLLTSLPDPTIEASNVFLDGEKSKINDYAVRKLREAGYTVFYVNKLHGKVILVGSPYEYIVVGTSNLTRRSLENHELVIVFRKPTPDLVDKIHKIFIEPVINRAYIPRNI